MENVFDLQNASEWFNFTIPDQDQFTFKRLSEIGEKILVYLITVVVMVSMGASVDTVQMKKHLARPFGLAVGMVCQFVLMPLLAFCLAMVFNVHGYYGTGVLLVSCCPGGSLSNIYTYFADGDISLSVAMTFASGAVALVAMPGNLWLYGDMISDNDEIIIPYLNIGISLGAMLIPCLAGYLFKTKAPAWAPFLTKWGSLFSFILVLVIWSLNVFTRTKVYSDAPWQLYASAVILPILAAVGSYSAAWAIRQTPAVRKTIAIEASIQNVGVALAVSIISFGSDVVGQVLVYPFLYAATTMIYGAAFTMGYHIMKSHCPKSKSSKSNSLVYDYEKVLFQNEKA